MSEMDDIRRVVGDAFAEGLAAQTLLAAFMRQLLKAGSVPPHVVENTFDDAIQGVVAAAERHGTPEHPTHLAEAARIIEDLREVVFPRSQPPKHLV